MNIRPLFEYIYLQNERNPLEDSMSRRQDGKWLSFGTQEIIDAAEHFGAGLLELGLKPGEKISIVSYKNRPEWMMVDLGAMQAGVVDVPLYPTISSSDYEYILNDAEVKYVFVGDGDLYDKVAEAQKNVPSLKGIYTLDKQEGRPYWKDMWNESRIEELKEFRKTIDVDSLATLIYTSGTTGHPKGVMLTHRNISYIVGTTEDLLPTVPGDKVLSFLPLCHVFERAVSYAYINGGVRIYFTGTDNLGGEGGDLQEVKPAFFTTVPRLLEKVYEAIYNKGLQLEGVKRKLFFWALSLTDDYEYTKSSGGLKKAVADRLIFSKWREALGGNVKGIVTGAAPCPHKILRVFNGAGIPVREGYGLSETSPTLTINTFEPYGAKIGTVGKPIVGVDIHIDRSEGEYRDGEGEILASGPNIMQGYYNKPDKTAAVFKEIDGKRWFMTGDVGKMVTDKGHTYLKITDRKKELLKTSGGKYVAPAPIESKFKEDFLIEQMMVIGDKRKFVSALIVPAPEALKDWCENNGVEWTTMGEVLENPKVIARYQQICDECNPNFSKIEKIKKFKLLNATWDAVKEDDSAAELTPTMKLKRRVVREKYAADIDAMYS